MPIINIETKAGQKMQVGDKTIIPFANSVHLKTPFFPGGLIWNRPVAVAVQTPEGQEYILPIQDVTRQILFALIGATLVSSILMLLFARKFRK